MATGAPDGVLMIQVAVTVENVPVVPAPAVERAAGGKGRYSGTDTDYQTVVAWTVATGKVGDLKEILIISSNYAKTSLQITVGAITWATAWLTQAAMPIIFEDLKLAAASVVTVSAKSTDGTSITVDAIITAKEVG